MMFAWTQWTMAALHSSVHLHIDFVKRFSHHLGSSTIRGFKEIMLSIYMYELFLGPKIRWNVCITVHVIFNGYLTFCWFLITPRIGPCGSSSLFWCFPISSASAHSLHCTCTCILVNRLPCFPLNSFANKSRLLTLLSKVLGNFSLHLCF